MSCSSSDRLSTVPDRFGVTVFGVKGFTAWVVIGMIWVFMASFVVVVYPLYESRAGIMEVSWGESVLDCVPS